MWDQIRGWRLLVTSFLFHQLNQSHRYDYRRQLEFIIEISIANASLFSSSSSPSSSSLSSWSQRESCSFVLKCKDCRLQWTLKNKKRTPSPLYIDHHNHNHHRYQIIIQRSDTIHYHHQIKMQKKTIYLWAINFSKCFRYCCERAMVEIWSHQKRHKMSPMWKYPDNVKLNGFHMQ